MEVKDIGSVLERILDLHDKLSDAIHSVSRAHFLNTVKSRKAQAQTQHVSDEFYNQKKCDNAGGNSNRTGYVFMKDYIPVELDDSSVDEAKSLHSIRNALENLEDQLEFLQTVKTQQRAERDAVIAHLEQSRIILAMRLSEHNGKNYKVIEEARAFVETNRFISPESASESSVSDEKKKSNVLYFLFSKCKSLRLHHMGGVIGNAALVALSMVVLMHVQQVDHRDKYAMNSLWNQEEAMFKRGLTKVSPSENSSSTQLDVQLARG